MARYWNALLFCMTALLGRVERSEWLERDGLRRPAHDGKLVVESPSGELRCQNLGLRVGKAAGCGLLLSFLFAFALEGCAEDQINGLLRVRCGLDDQAVILLQLGNPVLEISGGVAVGVFVGDTGN